LFCLSLGFKTWVLGEFTGVCMWRQKEGDCMNGKPCFGQGVFVWKTMCACCSLNITPLRIFRIASNYQATPIFFLSTVFTNFEQESLSDVNYQRIIFAVLTSHLSSHRLHPFPENVKIEEERIPG